MKLKSSKNGKILCALKPYFLMPSHIYEYHYYSYSTGKACRYAQNAIHMRCLPIAIGTDRSNNVDNK